METIYSATEDGAYESRYFNHQTANRLVVRLDDGSIVEVTRYVHYKDDTLIDIAVDIPSMVGCPIRCQFCATGKYKRRLKGTEMVALYKLAIAQDSLESPVWIASFQGIGEPTLNVREVERACRALTRAAPGIRLSIATVGSRTDAFQTWTKAGIRFASIQFSITDLLIKYRKFGDTNSLVQAKNIIIHAIRLKRELICNNIKINILMIDGITNDTNILSWINNNIPIDFLDVKISFLNTTIASDNMSLSSVEFHKAKEISDRFCSSGLRSYVYGAHRPTIMSCGQLIESDVS